MTKHKILKDNRGFTLVEALIVTAIMGFIMAGLGSILKNGFYGWNMGSARIALNAESRTSMLALTKFIQNAQSASIKISRLDNTQPVNSFISGKLSETVYVKLDSTGSCGFAAGGSSTVGSAGADFAIYQNGNFLVAKIPHVPSGADMGDPSSISVTYNHVTISTNLESLMMTFNDTGTDRTLSVGARFKKIAYKDKPPVEIMLKKVVAIKHHHSSGYYGN